jgi:ergothioneine biosynthesis protein EgtB
MSSLCLLTQPSGPATSEPCSLADHFSRTRAASAALAAPLSAEDCQAQSMPDASPVKWHLAHTTWFFETFILSQYDKEYTPFHPQYGLLFNSYYNALGERHPRPQRGLLTRPPLSDVLAYREHVDARIRALMRRIRGEAAEREVHALVELGVHHEQQHQELILTDVKHLLSCSVLRPAYAPVRMASSSQLALPQGWIGYDGGIVRVGHEADSEAGHAAGAAATRFSFDNETPAHDVLLQPYALARRLVTQGEYMEFMDDGGYERPELWLSLGWDTVRAQQWRAPMYWEGGPGEWRAFTLHGMTEVDPHAPVTHISMFEADAYARWASARLPREHEWEHAARSATPALVHANMLESGRLHPIAVSREVAAATNPSLPLQMYGDTWEWTASSYDPYPGFKAAAGAVGEYNGKFMCSQYVLRGGSCVTPASHIRSTYRNFFPPDARWQFSGIRLARDAA